MRYTVGKTVRAFLRTVAMTLYISREYSSGTGGRWLRYCGRFAERLSVIANAEQRDTSRSLHNDSKTGLWRSTLRFMSLVVVLSVNSRCTVNTSRGVTARRRTGRGTV